MTVAYWDNGTTVRHRVGGNIASPYPTQLDIILLFIAFFNKRLQIESQRLKAGALRRSETTYLWVRFFITYRVPRAPAKVAQIAVSFIVVVRKEEVHQDIRRVAITLMYAAGALLVIATSPKIVMVVWAL